MKIEVRNCLAMSVTDKVWYVVQLKGALSAAVYGEPAGLRSDAVFEELQHLGYDVYSPRKRFDRFNRKQRVMAEWSAPLLPGYIFIAHPRAGKAADDWDEVREIKGVLGPLNGGDGPLVIKPEVIEAIMSAEFSSTYDETNKAKTLRGESERQKVRQRFQPGTKVSIKEGPFASFLAEVEHFTQEEKVSALVDIFGRLVPVEFDHQQLEPAPKPRRSAA